MARSRRALSRKWSILEKRVEKAEDDAGRRLRLLMLYETTRKQRKELCFFCAGEWSHAGDCELAEELKDE